MPVSSPPTFAQPGASTAPLWQQLTAVAQALQSVRSGRSATTVLASVPISLRPGVQALLFQVLRQLGRAQALRQQLAAKTPPPPVEALLCTALALAWDETTAPYAPFTLVNQVVEAANRGPLKRHAGFLNACLRRFIRERHALINATDQDEQARWNHPIWWIEQLRQDYPQTWEHILRANNTHAPMALRVNRSMVTPACYLDMLQHHGIAAQAFGADGVLLVQPVPVQRLPGFEQGMVSVQDGAAQLAAPLLLNGLPLSPNAQILDACAAPGGKTIHLLEVAQAAQHDQLHVYALEVDAQRSQRIHEALLRTDRTRQVTVLVADAGQPQHWWQQANQRQCFDAILLDAPCSASGIVRRHPDVRWLRRKSDIAQLVAIQAQLLDALWLLLKPGGRMLYCTCSVFRAEGDDQIKTFLARTATAQLLPSPGHLIPQDELATHHCAPSAADNHDGFFYALLQKNSGACCG